MSKKVVALSITIAVIAIGLIGIYFINKNKDTSLTPDTMNKQGFNVTPITHASAVFNWDNIVVYTDPVGGEESYSGQPEPDIILLTDIHGDHLDTKTLNLVTKENTVLIAPQAVANELPPELLAQTAIMQNGQKQTHKEISIEAIPMYNLPESDDAYHTKGRGNGYLLEYNGKRVYVAGDTADIPEMRALQDIDVAFIPMNLPFTMDIETAADAVLDFMPKIVYPYHYRGRDGLSDVNKFKSIVEEQNNSINVILLEWYPTE